MSELVEEKTCPTYMGKPLKWHGGKYYLASKIIALMPPHTRYFECYAGGMSVLLKKPYEGVSEYVCDRNGELMNFWRVLQRPREFEQFQRLVETTPLSQFHFENLDDLAIELKAEGLNTKIINAYLFFIRARMSRQGLGKDYCTPTKRQRRGMNENVSAWLSSIDGLPEVHKRLRQVEVLTGKAVDQIKKLDSGELLVYADPPYLHETRSTVGEYGNFEMTPADHEELLVTLAAMRGNFLLSGYPSSMYDHFAKKNDWRRVDFELPNNASSAKEKQRKIESVWMNF